MNQSTQRKIKIKYLCVHIYIYITITFYLMYFKTFVNTQYYPKIWTPVCRHLFYNALPARELMYTYR